MIDDIINESLEDYADDDDYEYDNRNRKFVDNSVNVATIDFDDIDELIKTIKLLKKRLINDDLKAKDLLLYMRGRIISIINNTKLSDAERAAIEDYYEGVMGLLQDALSVDSGNVRVPVRENFKNKKHMKKTNITLNELKQLINQVLIENLQQEIGAVDYDDREPIDSTVDVAGDKLDDLKDTVDNLIAKVKNDTDDSDVAYDRLVSIHAKLSDAIRNPRLSSGQRKQLEHDYEGILGLIHSIVGGGGTAEKFYVNEVESKPLSDKNRLLIMKWLNEMGSRKAAIRMIDSILKTRIGLGTDDLADTHIFADGVDNVEQALEQNDYAGAFKIARDTAQSMIEDEGGESLFESSKNKFSVYYQVKNPSSVSKSGGWRIAASFDNKLAAEKFANDSKNKQEYGEMYVDAYDSEYDDLDESLSECNNWNEVAKHPLFKEAVLSEKAPPGMENWIKSNKQRFKHQYGDKKGIGALYATAWKMFYKNKNKNK